MHCEAKEGVPRRKQKRGIHTYCPGDEYEAGSCHDPGSKELSDVFKTLKRCVAGHWTREWFGNLV